MGAALILEGGRVFRGLQAGFAEAMAIADGKVLAVGTLSEVEAAAGPGAKRLDLAGRVATPALNEGHMHLLSVGLGLSQVNLRPESGVHTLDEVLSRVGKAAAKLPKGAWVLGRGYDHGELDVGRHPQAEELDKVAPDNPVLIVRTCGHVSVANSAAMKLAGVSHNTPNPPGGVIERKNGKLTGQFQERAMRLLKDVIPPPSIDQMVEAIEAAGRHLASLGFASATDMNIGMTAGVEEIAAYKKALADGRLMQRMWQVLCGNPEGIADACIEGGMRFLDGDDMLRWGGIKVFGDGSAGGCTAAFFDPYTEAGGGGTGVFCFSDEEMHGLLKKYHDLGWQLDIHAIGDAAIEQVLSGMEAASTEAQPILGRRHRIEHCGWLNGDQMRRLVAGGVQPVPQPMFWYEFGDLYLKVIGPKRTEVSNPMKSWLDAGLFPAASSDAPVCDVNPFQNIFQMITRKTNRGTVIGADQALTVEEAVHSYTYCAAFTQFAEHNRGTLEPGMLADVAVFSRDIFAATPEDILQNTQADLTLRGGVPIFDRHGAMAALSAAAE